MLIKSDNAIWRLARVARSLRKTEPAQAQANCHHDTRNLNRILLWTKLHLRALSWPNQLVAIYLASLVDDNHHQSRWCLLWLAGAGGRERRLSSAGFSEPAS